MRRHAVGADRARQQRAVRIDRRSANGGPRVDVIRFDGPDLIVARLSAECAIRILEPSSLPSHARPVLAVALALDRPGLRSRLQEIRRQYPTIPLVIITAGDAANLKRLLGLNGDSVVTVERIEDELGSVVHSLQHRSPLEVAARAFEEAELLDDVTRHAVLTAIRSVPPIRTVNALGKRLGLSRQRIWDCFAPLRVRTGWSCLDLLHAVALWRTIELLRNGFSLAVAWRELGLNPRTAHRLCRAHLGCAPSLLLDHADAVEREILQFVERSLATDGAGQIDCLSGQIAS